MPKSHKRWTSLELMLKRFKKRSYKIMYVYNATQMRFMPPTMVRDRRNPVLIAANREVRAQMRAQVAEVHGLNLALAMVFHPRLGENSLWHDLPVVLMHMIVCEAHFPYY